MTTKVTDIYISDTFNIGINTLYRWRKDTVKYPHRYELYRLGALLKKNDMSFFDVLSLAEKNIELEAEVNKFVDKFEQLKGIGK